MSDSELCTSGKASLSPLFLVSSVIPRSQRGRFFVLICKVAAVNLRVDVFVDSFAKIV